MSNERTKLLVTVFTIFLLLYLLVSWSQTPSTDVFPQYLGDMELKLYLDGEEAIQEINMLHSGNVRPEKAYIARYRNYDSTPASVADVWVSVSDQEGAAQTLVESMTRRMADSRIFTQPEEKEIGGYTVYYTEGTGQYHYYYAQSDMVVWIGLGNPDRSYQEKIVSSALKEIS